MSFRPERVKLFPIMWPWYLHLDGSNIHSNHHCGDLPSFSRTMAQKARSSATKTRGLAELHISSALGGGRGQLWVRIINYILLSCVQKRKCPAHICFSLYPIGSMNTFPRISPLSFLHWRFASLKIMVMFLTGVIFALISMIYLNSPFPWSPPITRLIDMID